MRLVTSSDTSEAATLGDLLNAASARLQRAGIDGARRDARLLIAAALETSVEQVLGYPERSIAPAARAAVSAVVERRARREPVSRILGRREFWGLPFIVTPGTLDPRADSESLVEAVLREVPSRQAPLRLLDLGTGTGCLLLALLSELPQASGVGSDISVEATQVARQNAAELGLGNRAAFVCGDWCAALSAGWQVIVSNPPYIIPSEASDLAPEVVDYDPPLALFGGRDGLDAYRRLVPTLAQRLSPGGLCALEVGDGMAGSVEPILSKADLKVLPRARDLGGRDRCVLARRRP